MRAGPLVLLRHGQTAWSASGRMTGWADPPLDATGRAEAGEAGAALARLGLVPDVALTSFARRAAATAELALEAAGARHVPVRADWRLNERHLGQLQGLDRSAAVARYGKEQVRAWRSADDAAPPPLSRADPRHPAHDPRYRQVDPERLPGSETRAELERRVLDAWRELAEPPLAAGLGVLVVGHCHALRALLRHLGVRHDPAALAATGSAVVLGGGPPLALAPRGTIGERPAVVTTGARRGGHMKVNRSVPPPTVVPVLVYEDVRGAVAFLTSAFGFEERTRIGESHRAQMAVGADGAVIVADAGGERRPPQAGGHSHLVRVRVEDVDAAFARARGHGAVVLEAPVDREYGERDCTLVDPGGHRWQLAEAVADVAPEDFGCESVSPWPAYRTPDPDAPTPDA